MTTDLKYLAWTALLTASLWIPYIVCQVMTNGNLRPADYLDPTPRPLPLWGQRLNRVHQNAVEVFAPFAALVLMAQITSKADAMTAFWAALFFWARVAHAIVFALGWPFVRTVAFTIGFIAVVGIFWEIVR